MEALLMSTDIEAREYWIIPEGNFAGQLAELRPDALPDDFEWYPDGPGQRMPQAYSLHLQDSRVVKSFMVFPVEPWSPYDAACDKLRDQGYEMVGGRQPETCEHGLSADLCAGPGHYPMDSDFY
jgi:hypothetical protein